MRRYAGRSGLRHRRHRVLLFSSFADRGRGGQESLFHLACELDPHQFSPCVVVPGEGGVAQSLRARGIDVRVLDLTGIRSGGVLRVASGLRRLLALVDTLNVDILHTDGPRNTLYAGVVGRLRRKPVVWHVRAFAADPGDRLLTRLCTRLILVADALRPRFAFCRDGGKLVTIHNGVDLDRFKPSTAGPSGPHPPGLGPIVIGAVGRVEAQKGLRDLLQALNLLKPDALPFRLKIAGEVTDNAYFRSCLDCCKAAGMAERVDFLGHVDPIEPFIRSVDIVALPSSGAEAFPRAVLEAMACGKPVVVTDAGGTAEAVVEGRTGFVVPTRAPEVLAARLRDLLTDEGLRIRMGRCGRRRAEALFDVTQNAAQTARVYAEVLGCC
jgi:glycosyltransferase involved in cell wall biosynthesis